MGLYKKAVITAAGLDLIARAAAGTAVIQFSKACSSAYTYAAGTDFAELTELQDIKQTVVPSAAQVTAENLIMTRIQFGNENILTPYMIQNIGLYTSDGETEILFSVSQAETPDQVPAYNGVAPSSFVYNIMLSVAQASSLQVTVNPAGSVTVEELQIVEKKVDRLYRDVIVHVPAAGWSAEQPYIQRIQVAGLKVGDPAEIWSAISADTSAEDAKMWKKMASMIDFADIEGDGVLFLKCLLKKPTADFKILLKGVSGV